MRKLLSNQPGYQLFQSALLLCVLTLLTACGFQLRGVGGPTVPDEWKSMQLVSSNPNSEFSRAVFTRFAINGVQWQEAGSANYRLDLGNEQFRQSNLSIGADARVSEFELTMSVAFKVVNTEGEIAMTSTTVTVVRQMENDPRNVVGKESELRLVQSEMRNELADKILRRIGFYASNLGNTAADSSADAALR